MKKLIIFDVDGVLVDSWPQHHKFLCDMSAKYNPTIVIPPLPDSYHLIANGMGNVLRKAGFSENQILVIISEEYSNFSNNYYLKLFDGVEEMIKRLSLSFKLAIVSSNERSNVVKILSDLLQYFLDICTKGDFPDKKTALLHLLSIHNIKPEEAVFIGDTMADYDESTNTGIEFVASGYGWQIRPDHNIGCAIARNIFELYGLLTDQV